MESTSTSSGSPYLLFLKALSLIPITHYLIAIALASFVFIYNYLEFHILQDVLDGFKGQPVELTFNSSSQLYHEVISKCTILHGRFKSTPWLASPHLQTTFFTLFKKFASTPVVNYRREIIKSIDGGLVALDWLARSDVMEKEEMGNDEVHQDPNAPIVIVVPGLTSDSNSEYIRFFTYHMAKRGWNVVVSNHRGLGGVPLVTDMCHTAGWTEDLRKVVQHIRSQFTEVPIFVVGTSLGANMMVKYLGEDGDDILIDGAAAVCCPWDLLICDRAIGRRPLLRVYEKALTDGLRRYAKRHEDFFTRHSDWDGIQKAIRVRDYDASAVCHVLKLDTADLYYRQSSCAGYVGRIKVPLLGIGAFDDPVCTHEAIIWDECRLNKNIVLATTQHGGHLGYLEGMDAKSLWWVRAVDEYLTVLGASKLIKRQNKMPDYLLAGPQRSLTDKDPYVDSVKKTNNQLHSDSSPETGKIFVEAKTD